MPRMGDKRVRHVEITQRNNFDEQAHYYAKALNSQLHEMVSHFFCLGHERIITRYTHLNPQVDEGFLRDILTYQPKHFFWGEQILRFLL